MQLKNLATLATVSLSNDFVWLDEHSWSPVVAASAYTITGALIVQSAARQSGRAITLGAEPDMGWVTRATLETLRQWAAVPLSATTGRFELTLEDARVFTVAFRQEANAIDAETITGFPARLPTDFYRITLRLMEIF